jgi:hypothetical protein
MLIRIQFSPPKTPTNNITGGVMPAHAPMEDST